jgi:hypothetical protein
MQQPIHPPREGYRRELLDMLALVGPADTVTVTRVDY